MKEKLFVACSAVGGAICGVIVWTYAILRANHKDRDGLHEILDKASASLDKVIN